MLNKKQKKFNEYNRLVNPKNSTEQTLMKLRALHHSRQKSKESRKTKYSKEKQYSDNETEITKMKISQTYEDQQYNSINDKIQQLQNKVNSLMNEKRAESLEKVHKTPIKRSMNSSQQNWAYRTQTSTAVDFKSKSIKNSASINNSGAYDSSTIPEFHQKQTGSQISIIALKLEACRFLESLSIDPVSTTNYFSGINNEQQLFHLLANIIKVRNAEKIKQTKILMKNNEGQSLCRLQQEFEKSIKNQKQLKQELLRSHSLIEQLQQRIKDTNKKLEQEESRCYRYKSLYEVSESNCIRSKQSHEQYEQHVQNQLLGQYQAKYQAQVNENARIMSAYELLKQEVSSQKMQKERIITNYRLLEVEMQKMERSLLRLNQRWQMQVSLKKQVEEQLESERRVRQYSHQDVAGQFTKIIDNLNQEIVNSKQQREGLGLTIERLQKKLAECKSMLKQAEQNYVDLNHDYTQNVQNWLIKEEYYEKTVQELRNQILEAHQIIANYSTMLAKTTAHSSNIRQCNFQI